MKTIPLTQGKFALVDDADFDFLNQWKWCAWTYDKGKNFYAKRGVVIDGKDVQIYMHIVVFGQKGVDHIDHNGLNNQRYNLRSADKSQNGQNRGACRSGKSGFKGVSYYKQTSRWKSHITAKGQTVHLGYFLTPILAAQAYDAAARQMHGEFACTNKSLGLLTQ